MSRVCVRAEIEKFAEHISPMPMGKNRSPHWMENIPASLLSEHNVGPYRSFNIFHQQTARVHLVIKSVWSANIAAPMHAACITWPARHQENREPFQPPPPPIPRHLIAESLLLKRTILQFHAGRSSANASVNSASNFHGERSRAEIRRQLLNFIVEASFLSRWIWLGIYRASL